MSETASWHELALIVSSFSLVLLTGLYWWETRGLRRERRAPHVVVYTEHTRERPSIIQIVIRNVGHTMAREVTFKVDASGGTMPQRAFGIEKLQGPSQEITEGPLFSGIPALGPRSERRIDWGQYGGLKESLEERKVYVAARFIDDRGKLRTSHGILEVDSYAGTVRDEHPLREIAKQVKAIAGKMP